MDPSSNKTGERMGNPSAESKAQGQSLKPTERRYGFKRIRWKDKQIRGFKCGIGERMSSYMVLVAPCLPKEEEKGLKRFKEGWT